MVQSEPVLYSAMTYGLDRALHRAAMDDAVRVVGQPGRCLPAAQTL